MKTITEILKDYTAGKATLEEVKAAIEGTGLTFDPSKNTITAAERTTHGLLLTGTGSMEKVSVANGEIDTDLGDMGGEIIFNGEIYDVEGDKLAPYTPYDPKEAKWQPDPAMLHRPEYAGQKVRKGKLMYRYDANGDAEWEPVNMFEYDADHKEG